MNTGAESKYQLQSSYFSFWQVMAFILVFAFIGSWVLRTFAGEPEIKKFTISQQQAGRIEFLAQTSKKPADNLSVTNTCHPANSSASSSQTTTFSDWALDSKTGYSGRAEFNIPPKQNCFAYVHVGADHTNLTQSNYTSL